MRHPSILCIAALACFFASLPAGCASPEVIDARSSALSRRQDRMDARTFARQDRWAEWAAREDARAEARFNSS